MAGRWKRYGGGGSNAAAAAPKGEGVAGTLRQFASVAEAANKAGAAVKTPGTIFNRSAAFMTTVAALVTAGGAALRYGGPLISQQMQHNAEARQDSAARAERSIEKLRRVPFGKPGRPWKRNAELCSDGECVDVEFGSDTDGRQVGRLKGGTALTKCHTEPTGKRVCEWKGKTWTEK